MNGRPYKVPFALEAAITIAMSCEAWLIAQSASPARTVSSGVYTGAQAKRGETLYAEQCSSCHGDSLGGGDGNMGPSLAGEEFLKSWAGSTVADLFERVQQTMPKDNPDSLTLRQSADLVSYILKANQFAAGSTELATQTAALKLLVIDEKAERKKQ